MADELPEQGVLSEVAARLDELGLSPELVIEPPDQSTDAVIRMSVDHRPVTLHALVKLFRTPAVLTIGNELRARRPEGDAVLVTEHVSREAARQFRKHEVQFLDAAGNMYVRHDGVYLWAVGQPPRVVRPREQPTRAFRRVGLQVLLGLLAEPTLVQAPYREIAGATGASLGAVPPVIRELRGLGYVVGPDEQRSLQRQDELLTSWVDAYGQTLRPKLLIDRFRADDPRWWVNVRPSRHEIAWGGETAAAVLTNVLRPEATTIYADSLPKDVIVAARLRRDPNGNVDIRRRFWTGRLPTPHSDVVPAPLIYADLIAAGDARSAQAAERIRKDYLDRPDRA
ncbi:hypothetical protein E1212_21415 [Jiangella ureilytica]|uniref:Uncharacterized protein n=1 Tax=Jiangella ureilytica TaxID=2530374 RepID=A0A4R4RG95_9ACTN|nr:type IV toxin-antitoxin system AbiEi family antitoxin [Jiangella ureilytica]TDC48367.1 hypothetical protein E1212_21415 [Jiangella ureilytica]